MLDLDTDYAILSARKMAAATLPVYSCWRSGPCVPREESLTVWSDDSTIQTDVEQLLISCRYNFKATMRGVAM